MPKTNDDFLYGAPAPIVRRATGLSTRSGASREEIRTFEEMHRQALSVRVEKIIATIAACSLTDLAKLTQRIGLDLIHHSQNTMAVADASLNPEYLNKFRLFADRSLGQALHDLLELQALGKENTFDIIADSPNFKDLPEEHKSWLQRLFGR